MKRKKLSLDRMKKEAKRSSDGKYRSILEFYEYWPDAIPQEHWVSAAKLLLSCRSGEKDCGVCGKGFTEMPVMFGIVTIGQTPSMGAAMAICRECVDKGQEFCAREIAAVMGLGVNGIQRATFPKTGGVH